MDEKYLLIKAKGGLGNRMLSAVTGLVYADLSGRTPIIDWDDGMYANPGQNAYSELFDTPITLTRDTVLQETDVNPGFWNGMLAEDPTTVMQRFDRDKHSSALIYRKYCIGLNRLDHPEKVGVFWSYLPKLYRLKKFLRNDERFRGKSVDQISSIYLEKYFTPNKRVQSAISDHMANMNSSIIGVHIRYTDRKIPLDKVKRELAKQVALRPDATVFLATDNAAVQDKIQSEFSNVYFTSKYLPESGGRLHTNQVDVDKVTEAENAMIDMWLLGKADHLIYSKNSTFSITSALLGDLRADQQTDVDRFNPKIVAKRFVQAYT